MKIAVLSRRPTLYSTRRLVEAGRERGHEMLVLDYLRCYMHITSRDPMVLYEGRPLQQLDAVIPRIGARYNFYGAAVVRQLELMGVVPINDAEGLAHARDKLRCLQELAKNGIGLPATGFGHSSKDMDGLISLVGGSPLVLKLLEGTRGLDVVLAQTPKAAQSVIEAFHGLRADILVQEYIREAGGADLQCFVVGNRLAAAILRQAAPGAFRSEPKYGGAAEVAVLTPEERRTAIRAVKAAGLMVGSVEMVRSRKGPLVIEINASPGLEAIEATTGVDLADAVLAFVEKRVAACRAT